MASDTATTALADAAPVTGKQRIQSIDTLRGVALLGILLMNIVAFGLPFAAYFDPTIDNATTGLNLFAYVATDTLVEGSMRTIFSMLFGAGLLIFTHKPSTDESVVKGLYYRRTFLLVLFGLFNAYILVWVGDILYAYGMTGLLLYFFRNVVAKRLAIYAGILFAILALLHTGLHFNTRTLSDAMDEINALPPGTELTAEQQETVDGWQAFLEQQGHTPELIETEIAAKQGSYGDAFMQAAPLNFFTQVFAFPIFIIWDVLAMMLLGMAFFKWGLFDASRSMGTYVKLMLAGFVIGIPLNYWESMMLVNSDFAMYWGATTRPTYDIGRLALACGYIGLVMAICKSGILPALRSGLAAVGQMALTNYLAHSLICAIIFLGFGFGYFNELERYQLYYVVFGIWVFQILFSSWWLKRYRFGPVEWLWRSLTYGKKQSMEIPVGS